MSKRVEAAARKAYPKEDSKMWHGTFGTFEFDKNAGARKAYQEGYEQAEKDTIERACKWIESLDDGDRIVDVNAFVNAFRNEMEEE